MPLSGPSKMSKLTTAALLGLAATAQAAKSLGEIKHVVMMMMENRSLQHVRQDRPYSS